MLTSRSGDALGRSDGRVGQPGRATAALPPWSRRLADYVLTAVAAMVLFGALFWVWPTVVSVPYDGVVTYLNVAQRVTWQPAGDPLGAYYPLEGMGTRLLPIVPPLLPHLWVYWLTDDPGLRIWVSYVVLTGMLAVGVLAYYRAAGVPRRVALPATWLALVLALTLSDLTRSTWAAIFSQAGMGVALALFLLIGRAGGARRLAAASAFVVFVAAFVFSDHVFNGYLAGPVLGVALLVHLIAARGWATRLWMLGAMLGAGVVMVLLGIPQWMVGLAAGTSRAVFFDELIGQPQHAHNAGLIYRPTDALTIVYVLAVGGTLGELLVGGRRRRALAVIAALLAVGLAFAGLIWLVTDYKWRGPAPAYFNVLLFPWLALMAARGLDQVLRWPPLRAWRLPGRRLLPQAIVPAAALGFLTGKVLLGTATAFTAALVILIVSAARLTRATGLTYRVAMPLTCALVAVVMLLTGDDLTFEKVWAGRWREPNGVQSATASEPRFAGYLRRRLAVTPGSPFRGYADAVIADQKGLLLVDNDVLAWRLWDIPTISVYSYYTSPGYHAFFTRLLEEPTGRPPNINHVTMGRADVRILRMLGVRYLMSDVRLEEPGLRRVARDDDRTLYEVDDPNIASFSPIRVQRAPDAAGLLALLANPAFDPRLDVAVQDDVAIPNDLVPATESALTFEPGGFRFTANSSRSSLVVLPIQYTRCLEVRAVRGDADIRAVRANLIEAGLVFSGAVEVEGRVRFGGPWETCLAEELAETDRLHIRDLVERRRRPTHTLPGSRIWVFGPLGLD